MYWILLNFLKQCLSVYIPTNNFYFANIFLNTIHVSCSVNCLLISFAIFSYWFFLLNCRYSFVAVVCFSLLRIKLQGLVHARQASPAVFKFFFFLVCLFLFSFEIGSHSPARLIWNSWSLYLCLLSPRIIGVCHQTWLQLFF